MLIAQYRYVETHTTCIFPVDFELEALEGAVRVSEPINVDFVPRAAAEIDAAMRAIIEKKSESLRKQLAKLGV